MNTDGSFTYYPNHNFNGVDFFYYIIQDELGATSNPARVDLIIEPINDPPVFNVQNSILGGEVIDSIYVLEDFENFIFAYCITNSDIFPYDELNQEVTFSIKPIKLKISSTILSPHCPLF